MNSKQRVLDAVARRAPDRVPVDFNANPPTLARLMNELGVGSHRQLLDRLHVDIVDLRGVVDPVYGGPVPREQELDGGVRENWLGWRTRRMQTATGPEDSACEFIFAASTAVEELADWRWFHVDWFDFSDFARRLEPWADLAIMASGASVFQHPAFLRGSDNLLADMALRPDMAEYLIDRHTDFYVAFFDRMFASAPGRVDILRIADDLGMQDRLLMSPAMFDRFIAPRLDRIIAMAHGHGVKVMFHTCGAVVPLVDRLVDLGVDMLDPIQVRAKGMAPVEIKARFGSRIALHGAIDTQYLLPRGTPEDVAREVRRMIRLLGPEGYVISPCHVLQTDVPTANVLALYDTAAEA
ncbi:MAG: uroporphyrinogen decarboxylase family protein [Thermoguttaceae bacterium]